MRKSLPGSRSSVSVKINSSRWAAYAATGAATALAYAPSADADIHYVSVNESFNAPTTPPYYVVDQFDLGDPRVSINFLHATGPAGTGGVAGFYFGATSNVLSAQFIGVAGTFGGNPYHYVGKLNFGESIANQAFLGNVPGHYNPLASGAGYPNSQWTEAGIGFIGFKFNLGKGVQYGWAQVNMNGPSLNSFTLIDYAFTDPGETLVAGQVPEPGSLSLLAVGAIGLLAWRKQRSRAAATS